MIDKTDDQITETPDGSGSRITAFHGIFEMKLKRMIQEIKTLRKTAKVDPIKKNKMTTLLKEAKAIKKIIKKERKAEPIVHQIELTFADNYSQYEMIKGIQGSAQVANIEVVREPNVLAISFILNMEWGCES